MQAMILAAGFGTRLLPYTLSRPKPLFPILNQPLLLLTIRRLQQAGCDHIVVNCHHLREQIVAALHGIPGVVVQEEVVILGTGGGLRKARALFRDEPVLVTNGDIYHTVDYRRLYRHHQETTRRTRWSHPASLALDKSPGKSGKRCHLPGLGLCGGGDDRQPRADPALGGLGWGQGRRRVEGRRSTGDPAIGRTELNWQELAGRPLVTGDRLIGNRLWKSPEQLAHAPFSPSSPSGLIQFKTEKTGE